MPEQERVVGWPSRRNAQDDNFWNDGTMFIVDRAPRYGSAFGWLGIEWVNMTFNIRNSIERWYRTFKGRTKRFYNNFGRFVHLFAYYYNHMRSHETLDGTNSIQLILTVPTEHQGIHISEVLHTES
jgi:hypothetical protein